MSVVEWTSAAEGFAEIIGAGKPDLPTMEEIEAAIAWDEARQKG
jgi:hypothetical protein